jgi:hypothetical protein
MKSIIFWNMVPCSPLSFNRRFRGTYRLHLQGRRNRFSKPASKQVANIASNKCRQRRLVPRSVVSPCGQVAQPVALRWTPSVAAALSAIPSLVRTKSNLGRLASYTCFERTLRNIRSEPDREVSVLFSRSRMQAMNSSLEWNMFFSFGGLWLVFCLYQSSRWRMPCPQKEGNNNLRLHTTPLLFKMSL